VRGGVVLEIECAHCGNKKLVQIPGQWTPMALGIEKGQQTPVIPLVLLGCPKCGFVSLFNPQAVKPQPFPERPAQAGAKNEPAGAAKA